MLSPNFGPAIGALAVCLASTLALGDVIHDESVSGDLSNDRLDPTPLTLNPGVNSILATSVSGDREYVRVTIPAGMQLTAINLVSYVSQDALAFIGVQAGPTLTEPPTGTVVGNLLGYSHFGSGNSTVGTDILDNIGTGAGAIGFAPPMNAGVYTFWIQQTGTNPATYQLDFVIVPGTGPVALLGLASLSLARKRRR